jgi:hypothetical protein
VPLSLDESLPERGGIDEQLLVAVTSRGDVPLDDVG